VWTDPVKPYLMGSGSWLKNEPFWGLSDINATLDDGSDPGGAPTRMRFKIHSAKAGQNTPLSR